MVNRGLKKVKKEIGSVHDGSGFSYKWHTAGKRQFAAKKCSGSLLLHPVQNLREKDIQQTEVAALPERHRRKRRLMELIAAEEKLA